MAGRKPLPSRLKILKGTDQPCRMNDHEPAPSADQVQMPEGMSPEAEQVWETVSAQLLQAKILTNIDQNALRMYCEVYSKWLHAMEMLNKGGPLQKKVYRGESYWVASPFVKLTDTYYRQCMQLMTEFGMTPSSRTRVKTSDSDSEKKESNPFLRNVK